MKMVPFTCKNSLESNKSRVPEMTGRTIGHLDLMLLPNRLKRMRNKKRTEGAAATNADLKGPHARRQIEGTHEGPPIDLMRGTLGT